MQLDEAVRSYRRSNKPSRSAMLIGRVLIVGTTASGCVSLAPPTNVPPLSVSTSYPADTINIKSTDGASAAATGWRDYFADERLQTLIAQALDNNRDLRSAVLRVAEARAAFGIQRANRFPSIAVGADAGRIGSPANLSPTGQSETYNQYIAGADFISWELDFWGRVRSLNAAALETFLAAEDTRRAATISLIETLANSYLSLRELDERIELAQQTVASDTESVRIFRRRYEEGSISKLDLTQVETLLTQAQGLSAQLQQMRAAQAHALVLLVGSPIDLSGALLRSDDRTVMHELRAGLPSDLLVSRPDIAAAEHQLKATHANIGAARAAFFPRVTLTGAYGSSSSEFDDLFKSATRVWFFGPSLTLPIFDGGRNRANLDVAKVRSDLAVVNYEKTVQTAFREVSDALSARRWLTEQVSIEQTTLAVQSERARLAQLRYDNGAAAFLEVLDARRDLLSAEQQLVQTRRELLSSRVSLYAALGGGSMEPVSASLSETRSTPDRSVQ